MFNDGPKPDPKYQEAHLRLDSILTEDYGLPTSITAEDIHERITQLPVAQLNPDLILALSHLQMLHYVHEEPFNPALEKILNVARIRTSKQLIHNSHSGSSTARFRGESPPDFFVGSVQRG